MSQPIYEYVMERLDAARGSWPEVADGTGMSKRTIEKIARREIVDPGVSHIQKLADYFRARELTVHRQHAASQYRRGQMGG